MNKDREAFIKEYRELCLKYGYCIRAEYDDLACVDKLDDEYFDGEDPKFYEGIE